MKLYVQSRGVSQDYHWVTNTENSQCREEPPIRHQVNDLIDPDAHSIVLEQFDDKLILLVTGLETSNRTDDRHRKIRNSIAWVGEKSDDELVLQALTVKALRDELRPKIDDAVTSGGKDGFEVKWSELENLTLQTIHGEKEPEEKPKIGNLAQRKEDLADEIAQLKCFPDREGFLVVATEVNNKNGFVKAGVWRGLSSKINLEDEDWEDINLVVNRKSVSEQHEKKIVMLALIISLCLNIWLVQQLMFGEQSQQIKNQNLRKENQELELKNPNLNNDNKGIEIQVKDKNTQWFNLQIAVDALQKQGVNWQTTVDDLHKQKRDLEIQVHHLESQVQALESPGVTCQNQTTRSAT